MEIVNARYGKTLQQEFRVTTQKGRRTWNYIKMVSSSQTKAEEEARGLRKQIRLRFQNCCFVVLLVVAIVIDHKLHCTQVRNHRDTTCCTLCVQCVDESDFRVLIKTQKNHHCILSHTWLTYSYNTFEPWLGIYSAACFRLLWPVSDPAYFLTPFPTSDDGESTENTASYALYLKLNLDGALQATYVKLHSRYSNKY